MGGAGNSHENRHQVVLPKATRGTAIFISENIIIINITSMGKKVWSKTQWCVDVHTHVCAHRGQRRMWSVSLLYHYPPFLRRGLSLNWKLFQLGCWAGEFPGSTFLNSQCGVTNTCGHAQIMWVVGDLNSGLFAKTANTLTQWVIPPGL